MALLALLGISFVGSVIWVVNTEASAIYYGGELGYSPWLVGAVCAVGQCTAYVFFYYGGEKLIGRWRWLAGKVAKVRARFDPARVGKGYLITTFVAAIVGLPPAVGMVALASGFGVQLRALLPIAFVGRYIRFTVLAFAGEGIKAWLSEVF